MRQIKLVSLAILLFASAAVAQDKLLTIDDLFSLDSKARVNFSGTPTRLVWAADGRSFRLVRDGALMRVNSVSGDAVSLLRFDEVQERARAARDSREGCACEVRLARYPVQQDRDGDPFY
jgi:hypothetical protein